MSKESRVSIRACPDSNWKVAEVQTTSPVLGRLHKAGELACPHDRKHIAQLGFGHYHQHGAAVGLEPGEEERINC